MRLAFHVLTRGGVLVLLGVAWPRAASAALPSCEDAIASNVEDAARRPGEKDLSAEDFAAVLNEGAYLTPCSVPDTAAVEVCVAVRDGKPVGVTVTTRPRDTKLADCISAEVAALSFPKHPKMDVARTKFAPVAEEKPRPAFVEAPPAAPAPVEPKRGCGCALEERTAGGVPAALLVAAGGAAISRRRRSSPERRS
jgi:MYXO-CTERM domain-containing protein